MKFLAIFYLLFLTFSIHAKPINLPDISFSDKEKQIIQSLSSQQYPKGTDPSNRVSGNPDAIKFGKSLFFDTALSGDGEVSCATCHIPTMSWANHEPLTKIRANHDVKRHVPSLWGVRYNRWYFWDGRADSLWSQAIMPIENEAEMAGSRSQVALLIINSPKLRKSYQKIFGAIPSVLLNNSIPKKARPILKNKAHPDQQAWDSLSKEMQMAINRLFSNIGKAIASFEETIIANNSPFDQFAEQLSQRKSISNPPISITAMRGLKLFIGKAKCVNCHSGANFSDGEFHHSFLQKRSLSGDLGRYNGIKQLLNNEFNANSIFDDSRKTRQRNKLDYVYKNIEFRGQFKTPSLRNVAKTYPYMHTGELQTLEEVLDYYDSISKRITPNNHQEILLKSIDLSKQEQNNLIEFLKSLTDESVIAGIL